MNRNKIFVIYIILVLVFLIVAYPIGQGYVSSYNEGNDLYKNGDYENAVYRYMEALQIPVAEPQDCMIRINAALSMCKLVQVDETDQDSIVIAIAAYQTALELLTQNDCYNHNDDAKQLKEDIEAEIERLQSLQTVEESQPDDKDDKADENQEKQERKSVKEKIQNLKEEATKEQRDIEAQFKNYDYTYNPSGKVW